MDLKNGPDKDYIVAGWFTPDYRDLAEKFIGNLQEYDIPYHLYAKHKIYGGWNTKQKPSVAIQALKDYQNKVVILMDIDCIINDDIGYLSRLPGDIAISSFVKTTKSNWVQVHCSSRVIVFNPTGQALKFARMWNQWTQSDDTKGDETGLAKAFVTTKGVYFTYLSRLYSGRNIGTVEGAVIEHDSEREKRYGSFHPLKWLEKKFIRSGKSKQLKAMADLSLQQVE